MELAVVHAQNHCGMAGAVGADVFYVFHVPPPLRPTPAAAHDPRSGIRSGAGACHCRTCFGSLLVHALCIMCPLQNFQEARDDINKLKDAIDNQTFAAPLAQLQQRTWLLHWSLFVFWNHESGRNDLIDLFMLPPYMSAIQINAPHLLRYLAFAVLVQRRRRNAMKDLIKVIQQESYEYSDPITQFLEDLFVHYDFDGAQHKLMECETVIENDFFLTAFRDEFMESARLFIFEIYCRIHQCIDIKMLAERLNMNQEAAEKWIANLIRNVRLNAKIDSQSGTVVMGSQSQSVHEQIIDKAKQLSVRTFMLANTVVGSGRV